MDNAVTRDLFIDAICGAGVPHSFLKTSGLATGLIVETGNQWDEEFEWSREVLELTPTDALMDLYTAIKRSQAS